jgi:alkylhydroperoxidase family enzyme
MHTREARDRGERQSRLDVLPVWRETGDLFTAEERAAIEFTEAVTLLPARGVPDDVYQPLSSVFSTEQVGALIMVISVINAYNRIGVAAAARPPRRD